MIENRDDFAETMRREHRTIQQLDAPAIFAVLQRWADDYSSGNYDLRNEATCRLAFVMVDSYTKRAKTENCPTLDNFANLTFPYI